MFVVEWQSCRLCHHRIFLQNDDEADTSEKHRVRRCNRSRSLSITWTLPGMKSCVCRNLRWEPTTVIILVLVLAMEPRKSRRKDLLVCQEEWQFFSNIELWVHEQLIRKNWSCSHRLRLLLLHEWSLLILPVIVEVRDIRCLPHVVTEEWSIGLIWCSNIKHLIEIVFGAQGSSLSLSWQLKMPRQALANAEIPNR